MKRYAKIIGMLLSAVLMVGSVQAYEFAPRKEESDENVIVVEAEDFVRGSGFEIVEGGKDGGMSIVGNGNNKECVEYDITFDTDVEKLVIYGVHKGDTLKSNLSYISINHFESYSLYDYELGKWNETRIFYGNVKKGTYTIKLSSVRKGQMIDKLIIKYAKVQSENSGDGEVAFKSNPIDDTKTYVPGDDSRADLDIKEIDERVYGSYFFEVEEGNISDKTMIGEDSDASGGKYWYAPTDTGLQHLTTADMSKEIFSRFKFKVTHKGNYFMWVRYQTPVKTQKSTWFAIDDTNYQKIDDGQIRGWRWQKFGTPHYLDVGWHTFDIKYRQPGHMIDAVVLTDVSGFSATGLGSLPGEDTRFDAASWMVVDKVAATSKFKTNNYRAKSDCPFDITSGDILVPATNLFNTMAVEFERYDGYCIAKNGRTYLKFYTDSDRVIINGKPRNTGVKSYLYQGIIPMVSVKAVKEAFGIDYEYNPDESTLNVYYDYDENYRDAQEGEIIVTPDQYSFSYEIPCDDPDAKVEVWFKNNRSDTQILNTMDYDKMNSLAGGGMTYGLSSNLYWWRYWRPAMPVYYKDGAFRGVEYSANGEPHDIKVKIVKDGKEDVFVKRDAFKIGQAFTKKMTAEEYAPDTGGELLLTSTFENISYYIDWEEEGASCEVTYRKAGDANWKKAYAPVYDGVGKQFRGSIVYLEEDTEYEVKAVINGTEKISKIRTWTSNPPVAQTIGLSEIYSGEGPLLLDKIQGTADGWIKIVADDKCDTINAGKKYTQAVMIYDCKYLIFEGIKIRGGSRHGINLLHPSDNVRILNCDIAEWGLEGVLDTDFGGYAYEGYFYNNVGGVYFYGSTNSVIERCYIHDPDVKTNSWSSATWRDVHPKGGTAIQMMGHGGMVVRYNDLIGSDEHRFNDVMEGTNNGGRDSASIGRDADVYGNMMIYSEDDSIELDGGQMNVRFYRNRIEKSYCGISLAPNVMGPSYIFENQVTNMGNTYNNNTWSTVKTGGSPDGVFGMEFFFNNTMDTKGNGIINSNYSGKNEYHSVSRNNVLVTRTATYIPFKNISADQRDDNDYDLLAGGVEPIVKAGDESHAVKTLPVYKDYENGDYRLADGSPGQGAGQWLDNFAEYEKVDMGAYQSSNSKARQLPFRPVDMYADRVYEKFVDGEEREITIHVGNIGEGHTYSLVKNRDFDWLEIISENGTEDVPLKPNTTVKFKVKGDLSKCKFAEGNGMVLFRLENGYSVPITLNCIPKTA